MNDRKEWREIVKRIKAQAKRQRDADKHEPRKNELTQDPREVWRKPKKPFRVSVDLLEFLNSRREN